MFGGYISQNQILEIEETFAKYCKIRATNEYQRNDTFCWIFCDEAKENVFLDKKQALITDGTIITKTKQGYVTNSASELLQETKETLLDRIVTNINVLHLEVKREQLNVNLSSSRASSGRIWYLSTKEGLVFCTDYRPLIAFTAFKVNPQAYTAIIKYAIPPDPITIIQGIKSVPSSHTLNITSPNYGESIHPYFLIEYPENSSDLTPTDQVLKRTAELLEFFNPIITMSGGVDSTLLAQYLSESTTKKIKGYHLAFGDNDPEQKYAEAAAEKTNVNLQVCKIEPEDFIETVTAMLTKYMHPFSDTSTPANFYLLQKIATNSASTFLIDGVGADAVFSIINEGALTALQKTLYRQPKIIREFEAKQCQKLGLFIDSKIKKLNEICTLMARAGEPTLHQCLSTFFPFDNIFKEFNSYNFADEIFVEHMKRGLIQPFNSKSTTFDIIQPVRSFVMKTRSIYSQLEIITPFLWRDILIEQGKLTCKKQKGINKWPLKKLLEKTMPRDFIYRKKVGFTPPLIEWLKLPQNREYAYSALVTEGQYIKNVIKKDQLEKAFGLVKKNGDKSRIICQMIWAALFTELWLKENHKEYLKNAYHI